MRRTGGAGSRRGGGRRRGRRGWPQGARGVGRGRDVGAEGALGLPTCTAIDAGALGRLRERRRRPPWPRRWTAGAVEVEGTGSSKLEPSCCWEFETARPKNEMQPGTDSNSSGPEKYAFFLLGLKKKAFFFVF